MTHDNPTLWAFEYFYHRDHANARIHCQPVRYSPITIWLADTLVENWTPGDDWTAELSHVVYRKVTS